LVQYRSGYITNIQWKFREGGRICDGMQAVFKDEDERSNGRRTSAVDIDICAERTRRCVEGKNNKEFRSRSIKV